MINRIQTFLLGLFLLVFYTSNAQLSMQKSDEGILITEAGQNVLLYRTAPGNSGGPCTRCNFIHPLYGVNGGVLTENAPADHPHHRGIFWAWHQIIINGEQIADQWELNHFAQEVVEFEFMKQRNGKVVLKTEVDWLSDRWKKDGVQVPYIREFARMEVWPTVGKMRRIDFEIRLKALEEGVQLGGSDDEKGYGGFSVRMALPDGIQFTGPNGKVEPQNEAVFSPGYVNISGDIEEDGGKGGIIIVDHKDNPGYPQSWILRSKGSMQNAVWPGREPVDISTSDPLVLKYSLLVYSGRLNTKKIQKLIDRSSL